MIQVRDAEPTDGPALADAHLEGWRVGYRGLVPDAYLDSAEFAANRRAIWDAWNWNERGGCVLFTVELDGSPVGFGLCGPERVPSDEPGPLPTRDERGEVYSFYLHPRAWGTGAAAALMSRCESWLTAAGYADAVLWVLRDNPRGRAFYEKAGWRTTGREMSFDLSVPDGTTHPLHEVEYGNVLL